MTGTELAVPKKFVFWSSEYAIGTFLWTAMIVTFAFTLGIGLSWASLIYLPLLAISWLGARRSRVSVSLEGDTLNVLAGVGPRTTLALKGATEPGADLYRTDATAIAEVNRAELKLEEEKGLAVHLEGLRDDAAGSVLHFLLPRSMTNPITVNVGRLTVTGADGRVRHLRIPGGDSDDLARLRDAINRKTAPEDEPAT